MQVFYANIKSRGESGVSALERTQMRDAIVDYGALHNTPVSDRASPIIPRNKVVERPATQDYTYRDLETPTRPVDSTAYIQEQATSTLQYDPLRDKIQDASHSATQYQAQLHVEPLQDQEQDFMQTINDFFDSNSPLFDQISLPMSSDIEAQMYNATQDFWANFPGETSMY
jgi:hypothetical protein